MYQEKLRLQNNFDQRNVGPKTYLSFKFFVSKDFRSKKKFGQKKIGIQPKMFGGKNGLKKNKENFDVKSFEVINTFG